MRDSAAQLRLCASAMNREADALQAHAASLAPTPGLGRYAVAVGEAQTRLVTSARDLADLHRTAADSLMRAANAVDEDLVAQRGSRSWEGSTATVAGVGAAVVGSPRLDAVAHELLGLDSPAVLEVGRSLLLPAVGAAVFAVSAVLGTYLYWRAVRDTSGPAPRVSRLHGDLLDGGRAAKERLDTARPATVSELIAGCADVDILGQQESAVVDIAELTTPEGESTWVVTLPSTKDWVVFDGDKPAPNDLDAILAITLIPGRASTYCRGIEEAVRQAGIPAGAPVLLVGFSLGGMAAADLARAGLGDVSVEGVVAAGAPIDTAEDPAGVPVLSVVHAGDKVPMLDFAPDGDGPLRVNVFDAVDEGVQAHSAGAYAATIAAHDGDGALSAPFQRFLVTDPATSVTHRQYQIVER